MKWAALYLTANLACLAAVCGAVFLAYHDKAAWGWMLFVAVIIKTGFKWTED